MTGEPQPITSQPQVRLDPDLVSLLREVLHINGLIVEALARPIGLLTVPPPQDAP